MAKPFMIAFILFVFTTLNLCRDAAAQEPSSTVTSAPNRLTHPVLQEQVDRFMEILNGAEIYNETEYAQRFSPGFVDQLPLEAGFAPIIDNLRETADAWAILGIAQVQNRSAVLVIAPVDTGEPKLAVSISVDASTGQVDGFLLNSADPPTLENPPQTMQEAIDQLQDMGHSYNFMVADASNECQVLAGQGVQDAAPIGSMFKFWVLAAVVDAIDEGSVQWDQLVTVTAESKSLPSGIVQDDPVGTERSVRELAELMISISDNTATDLLIGLVGRSAVEQALEDSGHHNPALNRPFLTTKDLFVLKAAGAQGDGQPGPLGTEFMSAEEGERREILEELETATIESHNLDLASFAGGPIAVEELEWFASPIDLCNVLSGLYENDEAARILAINPGIPDEAELWSYIGYKGGSEPGLLGMAWYLVPNNPNKPEHRVVTGTVWNSNRVIDDGTTVLLLAALRDLSLNEDFGEGWETTAPTSALSAAGSDKEEDSLASSITLWFSGLVSVLSILFL